MNHKEEESKEMGLQMKMFPSPDLTHYQKTEYFELELRRAEEINNKEESNVFEKWEKYIEYTTTSTEKDSKHTLDLMKRCITSLQLNPSYNNEQSFIRKVLKYADTLGEAQALPYLLSLAEKGVGLYVSIFYIAIANCFEKQHNFEKAYGVFQKGFQNKAGPINSLQTQFSDFINRIILRVKRDGSKPYQKLSFWKIIVMKSQELQIQTKQQKSPSSHGCEKMGNKENFIPANTKAEPKKIPPRTENTQEVHKHRIPISSKPERKEDDTKDQKSFEEKFRKFKEEKEKKKEEEKQNKIEKKGSIGKRKREDPETQPHKTKITKTERIRSNSEEMEFQIKEIPNPRNKLKEVLDSNLDSASPQKHNPTQAQNKQTHEPPQQQPSIAPKDLQQTNTSKPNNPTTIHNITIKRITNNNTTTHTNNTKKNKTNPPKIENSKSICSIPQTNITKQITQHNNKHLINAQTNTVSLSSPLQAQTFPILNIPISTPNYNTNNTLTNTHHNFNTLITPHNQPLFQNNTPLSIYQSKPPQKTKNASSVLVYPMDISIEELLCIKYIRENGPIPSFQGQNELKRTDSDMSVCSENSDFYANSPSEVKKLNRAEDPSGESDGGSSIHNCNAGAHESNKAAHNLIIERYEDSAKIGYKHHSKNPLFIKQKPEVEEQVEKRMDEDTPEFYNLEEKNKDVKRKEDQERAYPKSKTEEKPLQKHEEEKNEFLKYLEQSEEKPKEADEDFFNLELSSIPKKKINFLETENNSEEAEEEGKGADTYSEYENLNSILAIKSEKEPFHMGVSPAKKSKHHPSLHHHKPLHSIHKIEKSYGSKTMPKQHTGSSSLLNQLQQHQQPPQALDEGFLADFSSVFNQNTINTQNTDSSLSCITSHNYSNQLTATNLILHSDAQESRSNPHNHQQYFGSLLSRSNPFAQDLQYREIEEQAESDKKERFTVESSKKYEPFFVNGSVPKATISTEKNEAMFDTDFFNLSPLVQDCQSSSRRKGNNSNYLQNKHDNVEKVNVDAVEEDLPFEELFRLGGNKLSAITERSKEYSDSFPKFNNF